METILYIKNKNEKIQIYIIKCIENKLFKTYGIKDGKMIEKINEYQGKNINKKNETSSNEQAIKEYHSFITKQKQKGYVDNLDNLNKIINIYPMLAQTYDKHKNKIEFPCYCQTKLDGVRCLAKLVDNNVLLLSRILKEFNFMNGIKNELKCILNNNIILDGELYIHNTNFQDIITIVKQKTKKHKYDDTIQFHIYDIIIIDKPNMNYTDRYNLIKKLIPSKNKYLKLVCTDICKNIKDIDLYHNKYIHNKYEGLILRNNKGIYEIGSKNIRSYNLQKYKKFMEKEVKIIGFKQSKNKGIVFNVKDEHDNIFSVAPKGSESYRKELYDTGNDHIGKQLTIIYQELSKNNIPRFPIGKCIRNDI